MLYVGLFPPAWRSASNTAFADVAGYWLMICVVEVPGSGLASVSRRRCSLSSITASLTFPLVICAIAVDVGSCVYPRVSSKSVEKAK